EVWRARAWRRALFFACVRGRSDRVELDEAVGCRDGGIAQRVHPGLLAAGHDADRKDAVASPPAAVDDVTGEPTLDRNVVQRAEAVLQFLELSHEPAQPLFRLAALQPR